MLDRTIRVSPWEDRALRTIALFKLAKALLFICIGIGLLNLMHHNVAEVLRYYIIDPMHFDPENRLLRWILDEAGSLTTHGLRLLSFGAFIYASVFATEGLGLYFRKRWAEYMVLVSTGLLLPVEFFEIFVEPAWWKLGIATVNLAILLYLVHRLLLDSRLRPRAGGGDDDNPSSGPTGSARASKPLDHPASGSLRDDSGHVVSEVP